MIEVRVVCVPSVGSTSSHCASKRPIPGMMSSGVARPAWLSTVRRYFDRVIVPPRMTPSRKRAGIWPLPLPPVEVATSLPAAERSEALAPTALLPSTAPAFWAKLTAAMAVPDSATTRAMTATTMAGDGRRSFTTTSFGVGARDPTVANPPQAAVVRPPAPSPVGWRTRGRREAASARPPCAGTLLAMQTTLIHIALAQANTGRR